MCSQKIQNTNFGRICGHLVGAINWLRYIDTVNEELKENVIVGNVNEACNDKYVCKTDDAASNHVQLSYTTIELVKVSQKIYEKEDPFKLVLAGTSACVHIQNGKIST